MMKNKKKMPVLPRRLRQGDTIGIVAPASSFDKDTFYQGIAVLESMGFHLSIPDDLFLKNRYLAGSDKQRAHWVNRFFSDKKIAAILCARGGFGTMKMLSLLDFKLIRKNPKIFVGFSDISALLSVLYTECNAVSFHGPTVTTLANANEETKKSLFLAMTSARKPEVKPKKGITIQHGEASGPLIGGNLTTLCHLIGTPYTPKFKGQILMIEEKGEAVYRIDRMLSQMKLAGCFVGIKGLLVGSFEDCGKPDDIYMVIAEAFSHVDIPVLAGFDIGHGKTNITVPIGLAATLDTDKQQLTFHEPAVS
ncbi:MAG: LD-carboxypeptidase [Desulfobacterales bacterium]|nr:MAG: LD-carboxypeptidase [Desulfobacterales bacterium]